MESAKYRTLEALFRQTVECIYKLKSFTEESPGFNRDMSDTGFGGMMMMMTAIVVIGNVD